MIKIAHVMLSYLRQPETYIWQYIHAHKNFYPVIIARRKVNLDQFPIPKGKLYSTSGKRLSYQWFLDNWYRRVLTRPLGYAERIIRQEGVEAIHAHFGTTGCEYLPLITLLNIPLITSFYGFDISVDNVLKRYKKKYRDLFEQGSRFLVEGPCMRDRLISIGCSGEKISILRISIDLKEYKFKSHLFDPDRPIKILFVGRFVEKKGLEYALRALSAIKNEFIFEFRVIGGGELEEKLRQIAFTLGLSKEIKWLGIQPHDQVIKELSICDFLLQPSVTAKNGDTEGGAPTIILEAQACGVPIVSTYHADIPYITIQGESALLSEERDVDGLCANMRYFLSNPNIWEKMGKKGREHVEKNHSIKNQIFNLENVYTECITEKLNIRKTNAKL